MQKVEGMAVVVNTASEFCLSKDKQMKRLYIVTIMKLNYIIIVYAELPVSNEFVLIALAKL